MIFILKASVRAMDAAQQFLREKDIPVPEKFVITGGSKVNQSDDYIAKHL